MKIASKGVGQPSLSAKDCEIQAPNRSKIVF